MTTRPNLQTILILLSIFLWEDAVVVANHLTEPDPHYLGHLICDLECHHNGVCRFLTKNPHDLQKKMQSGHMVQQCLCPLGYRGMSCDVDVQDDPEDCRGVAEGSPRCECAAADKVSHFAGEQCRKPYTEFCTSLANSVGGHISYCTHGGKCRGDLISAERSPWNTDNNYLFQHAGCICPPEFHGEHCELLSKDYKPALHSNHQINAQKEKARNRSAAFLVFGMCAGAVSLLGLVLIRKVRRHRAIHRGLPQPPVQVALTNSVYSDAAQMSINAYSDNEGYYHDHAYRSESVEGDGSYPSPGRPLRNLA